MNRELLLFEIDALQYRYGSAPKPALALGRLELREASCVAFVGPNGSGKTTLLKLLNHLLDGQDDPKRCKGRIQFRGQPFTRAKARRHTVYLHQHPYMLAGTVLQNLEICARLGFDRQVLFAMLERIGLAEKKDLPARSLSGGEAQRLALARALVSEREILLLDEPTASTDAASALRIQNLLEELKAQKTILFSTHHRRFAEQLADRIIELVDGTICNDWRNDLVDQSSSR